MSSHDTSLNRTTIRDIQNLKQSGKKIAALTAYDAVMSTLVEDAGIDIILVGDSLGNTLLGLENTLGVRMEDMIRATQAVMRGSKRAFVVLDLPFGTYADPKTALKNSIRSLQEGGCQGVKLEGPKTEEISYLVKEGIPVMAHLGLTPQHVHQLGGYFRHGKTLDAQERLRKEAKAVEAAGAFAVVLECLNPELAKEITDSLSIPTIGIGSGSDCSGQILVVNDLIGYGLKRPPKFATPRCDVTSLIRKALGQYVSDVRSGEQGKEF